jgi:Tol biopolymer transport system component
VSSIKFLGPWLDDHSLIFMDHCGTGCQALVRIDVRTGEIQALCGHTAQDPLSLGMAYDWSPSLDMFVATRGGGIPDITLVVLGADGRCQEHALPSPAEFHAWSPDGKALLYSHWPWTPDQGAPTPVRGQVPRLYIWDVEQGKASWAGPAGSYEGAWSPDGEHLAFFLLGHPRYEGQQLAPTDFVPGEPFPLSLVVWDVATETALAVLPIEKPVQFGSDACIESWFDRQRPAWSPDGRMLAY